MHISVYTYIFTSVQVIESKCYSLGMQTNKTIKKKKKKENDYQNQVNAVHWRGGRGCNPEEARVRGALCNPEGAKSGGLSVFQFSL